MFQKDLSWAVPAHPHTPVHVPGWIGVDEAGRGCLAGPVVAGAVFLGGDGFEAGCLAGVTDSKRLPARERERLAPLVRHHALAWGLGVAWMADIDARNILQATFLAMSRALLCLRRVWNEAAGVFTDGNQPLPTWHLPDLALPRRALVRGDSRVLAIAAASVLAKHFRDRLMTALDRRWPGYGFARHKGYGTRAHREALARLGPCHLHRHSFAPCRAAQAGQDTWHQRLA